MPRVAAYVDLDRVGDALIKLPFVRAMRHAFPDGKLIWIAGRGATEFAHALKPLMTGLLDRTLENCGIGTGLAEALGPGRLDLLIDTQSHVGTTLALRRLRPRRFISAAGGYLLSGRWPRLSYRKPRRLICRLLDLLELATGEPARPEGKLILLPATVAIAAELVPHGPPAIAQVIGAGGRHKAWPVERHVALARTLASEGFAPTLILGPEEAGLHGDLRAALPEARFPLQEAMARGHAAGPDLTIALAARCAAGVAGDCGGGHMLAASGTALVSMFGPTDPAKFAPWAERLTILRAQDWNGSAMENIPLQPVLAAVRSMVVG